MLKLYMVLTYTFFKSYIPKICNDFLFYIYVCVCVCVCVRERERDLEFNWF